MDSVVCCRWWANHPQERVWLLRDKYGLSAAQIDHTPFEKLPLEVVTDVARLVVGEPLAYVIGWVPFLDFRIDLRKRTLIPRPETEFWVAKLMKEGVGKREPSRILDLCCGSGCIGISLARRWPNAQVIASDISADAVEQTRLNCELLRVGNVRVVSSDLFAELHTEPPFDLIVTNPPYLDPEVPHPAELRYEPDLALYAKDHGSEIVRRILSEAGERLVSAGQIWLESGEDQQELLESLAIEYGWKIMPITDQFGKFRGIISSKNE